jgi:hypothetical protein
MGWRQGINKLVSGQASDLTFPKMQLSDIVDVVGLTPVPSPAPSSEPRTEDDTGKIRCVCGSDEDDGFTIQCDSCLAWQHAVCVGIARNNVPEVFLCEECRPDDVDVEVLQLGAFTNF